MPEMASPEEIGKMQEVVEVSDYYDSQYFLLFGKMRPVGARLNNQCRDPEKIKAIIEAVGKVKVEPDGILIGTQNHLSFRDKSGRILCLDYSEGPEKKIVGSHYIDKSGVLYDAMQNAGFVGPPVYRRPGECYVAETTKRIQILKDIVKIERYDYDYSNFKYYHEAIGTDNLRFFKVCTDPNKIALIMEAIKKLDVSFKWKYPQKITGHLRFKTKSDHVFGMILSFIGGKEIEGMDFTDKTGVLYDALQNAGLIEPPTPKSH
jgi:hypothetical protein